MLGISESTLLAVFLGILAGSVIGSILKANADEPNKTFSWFMFGIGILVTAFVFGTILSQLEQFIVASVTTIFIGIAVLIAMAIGKVKS